MAEASETLQRALELDPDHELTQMALGTLYLYKDWDWTNAQRALDRAITRNPGMGWAHLVYAELLSFLGRWEEAIAHAERLHELDPLATSPGWMDLGRMYELNGEDEQAVATWMRKLELAPNYYDPHRHLGNYYCRVGRLEEAFAELQRARHLSLDDPFVAADLGHCYATSGRLEDAKGILAELDELAAEAYVSPMSRALILIGLGAHDEAFRWLEKAYELRALLLLTINVDPRYDALRSDPRFDDLVRRVGFPEA